MISSTLLFLIVLLLGIFYWQSNLKAKELAYRTAKELCERHQVQLLDESVIGLKFSFNNFNFIRHFRFDYSSGDNVRYHGFIDISHHQVISEKLTIAASKFEDETMLTPDSPAKVLDFDQFKKSKIN